MKPALLLQHFDNLAETLGGVNKLRELIVGMAMRGLLTHSRPTLNTQCDNGPFSIPNHWRWAKLRDVADYNSGRKVEASEIPENAWLLDLEDIEKDTSRLLSRAKFKERQSKSTKAEFQRGDVLYGKLRPYLNKVIVADESGYCTTEIVPIRPSANLVAKFLLYWLKSDHFVKYINEKMYGMKMPRLGTEDACNAEIPVAPVDEQHTVVAKVDQLLALCDELEARQQAQADLRTRLTRSAWASVTTATEPGDFATAWQRIAGHFDLLHDTPESVADLRQAILQLAVKGRLVEQDPSEEAVDFLLDRVAAERRGTSSKRRVEIQNNETSVGWIVPTSWRTEVMGNLFRFIDYRGKTPPKSTSGVRLLTAKNVRMGCLKVEPQEFVTEETYRKWMTRGFPTKGDLLFTTEAPMGNVCVVDFDEKFALAQRTINLHPYADLDSRFLMYSIMSKPVQDSIAELATGMTATGIKAAKLKTVPLPIPPIEEQRRIVRKVNDLLSLCDQLESQLAKSQAAGEKLLASMVHHLLNAASTEPTEELPARPTKRSPLPLAAPSPVYSGVASALTTGRKGRP